MRASTAAVVLFFFWFGFVGFVCAWDGSFAPRFMVLVSYVGVICLDDRRTTVWRAMDGERVSIPLGFAL